MPKGFLVSPSRSPSILPFAQQLVQDAAPSTLIQAAAENHTQWFQANADAAGGETRCENGLRTIYSPAANPDTPGEVILAFPQMKSEDAGAAIDAALAFAKSKNAGKLSCWSDVPPFSNDLGARLVARGFQWGWEPHWMGLDLFAPPPADVPVPEGLHIAVADENDWNVQDLPYYNRDDAARWRILARQTPRRTYHLGAWLNGEIVGHSLVYVSDGPLGVAGIYAVSVVPSAREQGIGRAVSWAACEVARSQGCRYVLLNAATHIYEKLGFVSLGHGQTWWMYSACHRRFAGSTRNNRLHGSGRARRHKRAQCPAANRDACGLERDALVQNDTARNCREIAAADFGAVAP